MIDFPQEKIVFGNFLFRKIQSIDNFLQNKYKHFKLHFNVISLVNGLIEIEIRYFSTKKYFK